MQKHSLPSEPPGKSLQLAKLHQWSGFITAQNTGHKVIPKNCYLYFALLETVLLRYSSHTWRRQWHPTPVLLPGNSHGRRSLVESDTTERLHFNFSLSCTGEGNGNPLQYSCLENPRNGGTRWTAVYGVAQSRTRLKRQQQQQQFTYHIIHIFKVYNPMFY